MSKAGIKKSQTIIDVIDTEELTRVSLKYTKEEHHKFTQIIWRVLEDSATAKDLIRQLSPTERAKLKEYSDERSKIMNPIMARLRSLTTDEVEENDELAMQVDRLMAIVNLRETEELVMQGHPLPPAAPSVEALTEREIIQQFADRYTQEEHRQYAAIFRANWENDVKTFKSLADKVPVDKRDTLMQYMVERQYILNVMKGLIEDADLRGASDEYRQMLATKIAGLSSTKAKAPTPTKAKAPAPVKPQPLSPSKQSKAYTPMASHVRTPEEVVAAMLEMEIPVRQNRH